MLRNDKTFQEDRPLLADTLSDEEFQPPHVNRQFLKRMVLINTKGRARYKVNGAAKIISGWSG